MKVWALTDGPVREGKYLVVRRDGTIPKWGHFVMADVDPAASRALRCYANAAQELGMEKDFIASVRDLADRFEALAFLAATKARAEGTKGADPDAPPHRTDNPSVVAMMRGDGDLTAYAGPSTAPAPAGRERALEEALKGLHEEYTQAGKLPSLTTAWKSALLALAIPPSPLPIPDGWRMVPIDANDEQLNRGQHVASEWLNDNAPIGSARYRGPARSIYRAMIVGAPPPPTPTARVPTKDDMMEALAAAYQAGCEAVQENYRPDPHPEFGEAASDYAAAAILALFQGGAK